VRRRQPELLNERGQIVGVLEHAALPHRPLTPAVAATIVGDDLK
jgi:hypothetical protein